MDEVKINTDEQKHIRTLSHYLEKIHTATGYQNKEVAELLGMDKSYYNKIRLKKFSPLTNSITTLRKFASLNNQSLIHFLAEIEEISLEAKDKEWMIVAEKAFTDVGPILRRALLINRIKPIIDKDDEQIDILIKNFLLLCLIIDISKKEKWFKIVFELILKIYQNIDDEKDNDIRILIERIRKYKEEAKE
ncbi:hypothetical protein [Fluviispira multicolorata]|uniref:Uncharacterized protein n=1 Tax=Fluviispira multicolorata TaxID=2654512 RepID=A0A833JDF6_9BACT|nr:hypothetical protein [Fluviispira multicolorata]KAB8031845.1 hypothetical protein GCL57_04165 [Fluviispira multicolorata]